VQTPNATPGGGTQDLTGLADVDWTGSTPASSGGAASRTAAPGGSGSRGAATGTPILASPTAPRRDAPPAEASSGGSNTGLIVGIVVGAVAVVAGGVVLGVLLASPDAAREPVSPTIRAGVISFQ
jgi:hypothetical protein